MPKDSADPPALSDARAKAAPPAAAPPARPRSEGQAAQVAALSQPVAASLTRRLVVFIPLAVFAGLAALFLLRLQAGDPSRLPSALIGKPAPDFSLPPLEGLVRDGRQVPGLATSDLHLGPESAKVTLVNVWASWCAPCRDEHPLLVELAGDPRIRIVGIDYKDNPENARRFLGTFGNPFATVGTDATGRTAIDWGVYGVPETFIVGPDGVVRYKHVGPLTVESIRSAVLPVVAALAGRK